MRPKRRLLPTQVQSYQVEWDTNPGVAEVQTVTTSTYLGANELQTIRTFGKDVDEIQLVRTLARPHREEQWVTATAPAGATLAGTFALALDTRPTGGTLQYTGAIPASAAACCGRTSVLAMVEALHGSNLSFDDVGYVNAHAASTPLGDAAEAAAIAAAFAGREHDPVLVSSTKGATGHLLGAAGALEAALTALALRDGVAPRTANLDDPLPVGGALRLLRDNEPAALACALSNSFGFGGTNASLLLARPPADLVDARGARPWASQ